ncbi:MAG: DUF721 domain-containing protein [Bifidobacteriaceae bacterium]|nr:DUF721 domain-containing protein [Bifidobacteriaceae bacterium]
MRRSGDSNSGDNSGGVPGKPIAEALRFNPSTLAEKIFNLYCPDLAISDRERRRIARENFGKPHRDPKPLSFQIALQMKDPVWRRGIALAQLTNHWADVVGEGIAHNCTPVSLEDGVLTIRPRSTTWREQLKFMVPRLVKTINDRVEGLKINDIKVTAANDYSFRRGKWDVKGRGVRDTYF